MLPFGERLGIFDSWPSHALYAGGRERTTIYIGSLPDDLPEGLRIAARGDRIAGWTLHPSDWARRVRGVPAYPQIRYTNGLAEWIAGRLPGPGQVGFNVNHWLPPTR